MTSDNLSFGEYRLDTARRELWRGDELVALPAKVFDCIAYLAEHRDRAVGRDELIAAVWGRADVTDNLLDQIMLRARRAVGDVNGERHVIRTIPRFGFSWVAAVDELESKTDTSAPASVARSNAIQPSALSMAGRNRRISRPLLAVLALIVLAGCLIWFAGGLHRQALTETPASGMTMVLPVLVGESNEAAWMRLGLMDAIAARLREAGLPVVQSDNVVALMHAYSTNDTDFDQTEITALAKATRADTILEARAEPRMDNWRITLRSRHGRAPPISATGEAADPLAAAYFATDNLIRVLGLPAVGPVSAGDLDLDQLLQQVKAAVWSEQHDHARALLRAAATRHSAELEVHYWLAEIDQLAGHDFEARSAFEALLNEPALADDPILHAKALYGLGFTFFRQSDYDAATVHFDQAVELLEAMNSIPARNQLGIVLNGRAAARMFLRRFDEAQEDFARSRNALESSGDRLALVRLDNNVGVLHMELGSPTASLPYLQRAAENAAIFHAAQPELRARINSASAQLDLLDPAAALSQEPRVTALLDEITDEGLVQFAKLVMVRTLEANGHLREAGDLLRQVEASPLLPGEQAKRDWAHALAAELALKSGRFGTAERRARQALTDELEQVSPGEFAWARLLLLRAQLAQEKRTEATATAEAARAWNPRDVPLAIIIRLLTLAESDSANGAAAAAGKQFERALVIARESRLPSSILLVSGAYVRHLLQTGQLQRAVRLAGQIAGWAARDYEAALVQLRLYHALAEPTAWRSALVETRKLAGERVIPSELLIAPTPKS